MEKTTETETKNNPQSEDISENSAAEPKESTTVAPTERLETPVEPTEQTKTPDASASGEIVLDNAEDLPANENAEPAPENGTYENAAPENGETVSESGAPAKSVSKRKRIISIISFALSAIIFALALSVFIITLTARSQNRPAVLFGYSFAVVVTDSMVPEIDVGELIIIRSCGIDEIAVGENAVFVGLEGEYKDKWIVHKVIEKTKAEYSGETFTELTTKGVNNPVADENKVTSANFLGVAVYHNAALGGLFTFLQQPMNWVYILVIVVVMVIAVSQVVRIVKIVKTRKRDPSPDVDGKDKENKE